MVYSFIACAAFCVIQIGILQCQASEKALNDALQLQEMRERIFSFGQEDDWTTQNQIRQINQESRALFERETGISDRAWKQLDSLHAHFGRQHWTWFDPENLDPCNGWEDILCDDQGRMTSLVIRLRSVNELRADIPIHQPFDTVTDFRLSFYESQDDVDLEYIARLFPNLQDIALYCNDYVKTLSNVEALAKMPLINLHLEIRGVERPFPFSEWLPHMAALRWLSVTAAVALQKDALDLRQMIPSHLQKLDIKLEGLLPRQVIHAILSDDLIVSREQEDGSVVNPLVINIRPSARVRYSMECEALDPSDRMEATKQDRKNHPLTLVKHDFRAKRDDPIYKFAVFSN